MKLSIQTVDPMIFFCTKKNQSFGAVSRRGFAPRSNWRNLHQINQLLGGFSPTALKNDVAWVKVTWDDFPFPTVSGKSESSHVPNHQSDYKTPLTWPNQQSGWPSVAILPVTVGAIWPVFDVGMGQNLVQIFCGWTSIYQYLPSILGSLGYQGFDPYPYYHIPSGSLRWFAVAMENHNS